MSDLIIEHLKPEELPSEWVKQFPAGRTFTVTIVSETPVSQQTETVSPVEKTPLFGIWRDNPAVENVDSYIRNLRKGRNDVD